MKFISPNGIAAKMMALIEEAEKTLIIVSPYVDITKWGNMKRCLERAVKRGVNITFIMRRNQTPVPNLLQLKSIGIEPMLVDNLHSKLYINDKYGIVTSQNMILYSDVNSIDIAYETERFKEREELVNFVNIYILETAPKQAHKIVNSIPANKIPFIKIDEREFDSKVHLKDYQIERLYNNFIKTFSQTDFRFAIRYIFSDKLLPFADVIIDSRYVIKIDRKRTDKEQIVEKLKQIQFSLKHAFKVHLVVEHPTHIYIEFIPVGKIDVFKLAQDYVHLTTTILNSKVITVLSKQQTFAAW